MNYKSFRTRMKKVLGEDGYMEVVVRTMDLGAKIGVAAQDGRHGKFWAVRFDRPEQDSFEEHHVLFVTSAFKEWRGH